MNALKIALSALLLMGSVACSKSDMDNSVAPATTGVMSAQVDGQSFQATQPVSTYDKKSKDLTVTGGNTVHLVGFTLFNFSTTGTMPLVDIGTTGSTGSYTEVKTNQTYTLKEGRTGSVTVTNFDGNTISGTFAMKTYNTQLKREVVVTNGSFTLPVINL